MPELKKTKTLANELRKDVYLFALQKSKHRVSLKKL
jgi:hypothetical protein